ncbi:MAG TPA: DUF2256 domain-containing protein [Bacteroidetes bacterium]|nr:DUF2256 domain-containing protein [Bacteroidota bacterium]HIL58792.1 DUF2256 domain-containing protein [Rhodothermales bacterium]
MAHRKPHLPSKTCAACGHPFRWRKKWERDWDRVAYCSKRCQREAATERRAARQRPS